MQCVEIVEVAPRDGLQNESTLLPPAEKVELVRRALAAGVRRVEVTSFVHPRLVPQMADAEAVMAGVLAEAFLPDGVRRADVRYAGLVLNERGLARAVEAGVDEVNVVVVATETFSRRNQNVSVAQALDRAEGVAAAARAAGVEPSVVVAASFGCPFEGEVDPEGVLAIAARCLGAGYGEIGLADTIGVGVPAQVRSLVAGVRALPGGDRVRLRAHFHNTRNTGYANALAAAECGVEALDASLGGIGGCPFAPNATGNIATEDLQYLLQCSGWSTGLDLAALADAGTWIAGRLGIGAPALLGRAGPFPSP
jgi:hydroxymethylglutaryl-CoA lyase